jgi:CRISPR system Cascade subunit CasB
VSVEKEVVGFVMKKLGHLKAIGETGSGKAILAKLRRGIGQHPGSSPELWETTLGEIPESLWRNDREERDRVERCVFTALTLFALHQQGKSTSTESDWMQRKDQGLGTAMQALIHDPDERERITKRFVVLATSESLKELTWHLRGAVQLLRRDGIPLDYAQLAGELYAFDEGTRRNDVRMKWGRQFYRNTKPKEES